jgi:diaminopimelate epimerase
MATYNFSFTKMAGAGNDFVVLDNRTYRFSDRQLSAIANNICGRRTSVGADGLLALAESTDGVHDYRMRYFNADGSRATMCGNGARCLARFAAGVGFDRGEMRVESDAGTHRVDVPNDSEQPVRLYMPMPEDRAEIVEPEHLPDGSMAPIYQIWTGTEHVVSFVENLDDIPVTEWGRMVRKDPVFAPAGTNVNFVERRSVQEISVRTYEKGVEAETLACGTGAVASAWTTHLLFAPDISRISVRMPGGRLNVGWDISRDELYLEGEARTTFVGAVEISV